MENDWESKINEWLSGESPRFIGKIWQVVVELEAERKSLGYKFKIPLYRKRFEKGKILEGTIRTLFSLNTKGFIKVGKEPLRVGEIAIFRDPETEIELTDGFKHLYAWLRLKVYPEEVSIKFNPKVFLKQIFEKYAFTKKQKKLLYELADGKPHETKSLREKIKTKDLATLKKTTLQRIRHYELDKILIINRETKQSGFALLYYYQLEIHSQFYKAPKIIVDKK